MAETEAVGSQCVEFAVSLIQRFEGAPLTIEIRQNSVVFQPSIEGGFAISMFDEGDSAMVAAERWHCHYDDPQQAAFCVLWLLTPYYRVVHEFKGALIATAWLERYEADGWQPLDPAFFLNPDVQKEWQHQGDWLRTYHCQYVLPSPWPYEQVSPGAVLEDEGLPAGLQLGKFSQPFPEPLGLHLK